MRYLTKRAAWIVVLCLVAMVVVVKIILSGVEDKIEERWPKENLSTIRAQVEQELSLRIAEIEDSANVMVFVPAHAIVKALTGDLAKLEGIANPVVQLGEGLLLVETDFEVRADKNAPQGAESLRIRGHLAASAAPFFSPSKQGRFRLVLTEVTNVKAEGGVADRIPEPVKEYVASLVVSKLDQINGIFNGECAKVPEDAIIAVPSCLIKFPTAIPVSVDLQESLKKDPKTIEVRANPISATFSVDRAAFFISSRGLFGLARFELNVATPPASARTPRRMTIAEVDKWFLEEYGRRFDGGLPGTKVAMAVTPALIAASANQAAKEADLHLRQTFSSPPELFDTEVRLAKRPEFSCSRDSCSRTSCRRVTCHTRTGKNCGVGGLVGELVCKVVTNTICETANAAGDLICNTVQEVGRGTCNVFEELKRGGCNLNREFVDKALGRVGRVSGDYALNGQFDLRLVQANMSPDLKQLSLTAVAGAEARAEGSLKFTPLDHGHVLVCAAQWKERFNVGVNIPVAVREIAGSLSATTPFNNGVELKYKLTKFAMEGKVHPAPFDAVFSQHPHLRINCAFAAAIGDLAKLVNIVDPENDIVPTELNEAVTGKVNKEVEDAEMVLQIPDNKLMLFDQEYILKAAIGESAVMYLEADAAPLQKAAEQLRRVLSRLPLFGE